jgi:hypothetical protein
MNILELCRQSASGLSAAVRLISMTPGQRLERGDNRPAHESEQSGNAGSTRMLSAVPCK